MVPQDQSPVLSHTDGNVGHLVLNRPEQLNAFSLEMAEHCLNVLEDYRTREDVRVVVVRGAGRVFSAGGDIKQMLSDVRSGKDRAAYFRSPLATFHKLILSVRDIPKPVLAAVHGAVAGYAFNLMLACDLRIAKKQTRLSQAFIKLGLTPDGGGTYFLPRLLGHARTCELTMLPTEIDAEKALSWGILNWVTPHETFDTEVQNIAARLASGPTTAIGRIKLLINRAYYPSLAEHLENEQRTQIENAATGDFEEGLTAFVEKREPGFRGQ